MRSPRRRKRSASIYERPPLRNFLPSPDGEGRERNEQPAGGRSAPSRGGWTQHVDVALADGGAISARLLVAADGARSSIRTGAGIATHGWSYAQSAIVTNVGHERDHQGRAEEHFLPAGPFAILPLQGPPLLDRVDRSDARGGAHRRPARRRLPRRARTPLQAASRRDHDHRSAPARSRSASSSRARSSPSGSRSSATPPMSSTRSPDRDSIWA